MTTQQPQLTETQKSAIEQMVINRVNAMNNDAVLTDHFSNFSLLSVISFSFNTP
jgi:hypothetical protein